MTTKNFKTLHVWDTEYSADSVEWCPISPYKNFFVCGTYHLVENIQDGDVKQKEGYQRLGRVILFKVSKDTLLAEQTVDCPAVLDMKWSFKKINGNIALALANDGEISMFYLEDGRLRFIAKYILKQDMNDHLALSLDWVKSDSPDLLCVSDSRGNITLIKLISDTLKVLKTWSAHTLEAWIVCFDSFNENIIYTGGDEAELKVWDKRCEDVLKVATIKEHSAGVTALNSNVHEENKLVSGSYDEKVIFWDSRNRKSPTGSITASGGIWRLKWEPQSKSSFLLAACIYGGFQIYDVNSLSVIAEYKEHDSLAYGADWCTLSGNELESLLNCDTYSLISTCSFYDHKLCVSSWDKNVKEGDG